MKDKPFIKLLKSPYAYYFYDVHKNEIIEIDKETYEFLGMEKEDFSWEGAPKLAQELKETGYLRCEYPKEIRHVFSEILPIMLERKMKMVILQVTQQCNLRCKYCLYTKGEKVSQREHGDKIMSWETAKKAIDYLIVHSVDSSEISVCFYGGEPLLNWGLIKKCVEYTESECYGKRVSYNLTTNATLLTDEIINFFVEYNFSIMISLDGPKEINDRNRVFARSNEGTYDIVVDKLRYIRENYPDFFSSLQISIVINPEYDLEELCRMDFETLGIRKERIHISMVDIGNHENIVPSEDFIKAYDYNIFLSCLEYMNMISEKNISPIIMSISDQIFYDINRLRPCYRLAECAAPSGPCLPGQTRLFVSTDGTFYPCERVSETSNIMKIGDVDSGICLDNALKLLNVAQSTSEQCRRCWAFRLCKSCVRTADDGTNISAAERVKACAGIKAMIQEHLEMAIMFREIPLLFPEGYHKYINNSNDE